ncbi:MAG: sugar ABC transporter ATP-binding protein [candidate division Zixibacteria bacterium]|nr:sugar ABC transporter ATP-binding protein [candidate division Zixibacteria bacterium]MDD5426415.1 sugar ABC transporter ATP-binding protein [candidate division Zixibacteria bacterium]
MEVDTPDGIPVLEMEGIQKAFPGVWAVKNGFFNLRRGEVHALVGENGAGKSTLIKILTGVHQSNRGRVYLFGRKATFHSPLQAQRAGLAAIYQEFSLVPYLSVHANLFLGRERTRRGFLNLKFEKQAARAIFDRLGVDLDITVRVDSLDVARQQVVEIARALAVEARILVMDEPTAALAPREVAALFNIMRELTNRGISIIFISHRLDEVFAIADRITVMRDGVTVGCWDKKRLNRRQLIEYMVGRPLEKEFPRNAAKKGKILFETRHLEGGRVKNVSLTVRSGEVLGLAGLMGAGRTDIVRLLFGADPKTTGEIFIDGQPLKIKSPRDALRHGICLLTEDRKGQGLILKASARENFALPNLGNWSRRGWLDLKKERLHFLRHVENLKIRLYDTEQPAEHLSGGNQQKLLVARWLEKEARVVIFDEPTRGIDVGAKYEMYLLINQLAENGKAVIVISSELPEILGISDRILVVREGEVTGEITDPAAATQEEIMALAT